MRDGSLAARARPGVSAPGFQVVLSDLDGMARCFRREAGAFEAIMPTDGPPCPDAGGADVDAAMRAATQLLGLLHRQLAAVIGEHGRKLQAAHDNYERTETSLTRLAADLTTGNPV
jgi:Family of unknown function (DUF6317)